MEYRARGRDWDIGGGARGMDPGDANYMVFVAMRSPHDYRL